MAEAHRTHFPSKITELPPYQGAFDAYRLASADEMNEIGCQEIFDAGGVSAVEWADHVAACLPPEHFLLTIRVAGRERRELTLEAIGPALIGRLAGMRRALQAWQET